MACSHADAARWAERAAAAEAAAAAQFAVAAQAQRAAGAAAAEVAGCGGAFADVHDWAAENAQQWGALFGTLRATATTEAEKQAAMAAAYRASVAEDLSAREAKIDAARARAATEGWQTLAQREAVADLHLQAALLAVARDHAAGWEQMAAPAVSQAESDNEAFARLLSLDAHLNPFGVSGIEAEHAVPPPPAQCVPAADTVAVAPAAPPFDVFPLGVFGPFDLSAVDNCVPPKPISPLPAPLSPPSSPADGEEFAPPSSSADGEEFTPRDDDADEDEALGAQDDDDEALDSQDDEDVPPEINPATGRPYYVEPIVWHHFDDETKRGAVWAGVTPERALGFKEYMVACVDCTGGRGHQCTVRGKKRTSPFEVCDGCRVMGAPCCTLRRGADKSGVIAALRTQHLVEMEPFFYIECTGALTLRVCSENYFKRCFRCEDNDLPCERDRITEACDGCARGGHRCISPRKKSLRNKQRRENLRRLTEVQYEF